VADYGMLTVLAQPLFNALDWVHGVTGNWGAAIILVTLLLKALFYPLSETSGALHGENEVAFAAHQEPAGNVQGRSRQARSRDDGLVQAGEGQSGHRLSAMIIQIPVFFAFYQVLLESVEMRQAPFAFWIHDLSARDPLFILPAIMAAAMFMQYKLNPTAADPVQQKVFMIMPLVMSFTFAFFPAGLVLYWVTNTLLSIAQQWNINRRIAAAAAAKKN